MATTPSTPETVQELLDRQEVNEDTINFQELACKALLKCTAHENFEVVIAVVEAMRDWHLEQSKEPENNPAPWLVDAARLDVALKTLNLVRWDD